MGEFNRSAGQGKTLAARPYRHLHSAQFPNRQYRRLHRLYRLRATPQRRLPRAKRTPASAPPDRPGNILAPARKFLDSTSSAVHHRISCIISSSSAVTPLHLRCIRPAPRHKPVVQVVAHLSRQLKLVRLRIERPAYFQIQPQFLTQLSHRGRVNRAPPLPQSPHPASPRKRSSRRFAAPSRTG